jgi:glycoside/pentoside/hexuronide:cation symporter, GPH family
MKNVEVQTAESLTNLRIADILIPVLQRILAIAVVWKYNITEEKSHEIREALVLNAGEK